MPSKERDQVKNHRGVHQEASTAAWYKWRSRARKRGQTYSDTKTLTSTRATALGEGTLSALKDHQETQKQLVAQLGNSYRDLGRVFSSQKGTPLEPRNLVRQFKVLLKKAGLPTNVRFHDLRHTCATLLLTQGIHSKVVSERPGHASIGITLDIYSHVVPGLQEKAAAAIEQELLPKEAAEQYITRQLAS